MNRIDNAAYYSDIGYQRRVYLGRDGRIVCKTPVEHCFCSVEAVVARLAAHDNGYEMRVAALRARGDTASCLRRCAGLEPGLPL